MPTPAHVDKLSEQRHVTVILRLVVDERGRLMHGEVVGVESRSQGHFVGWRGLTRAVRGWLAGRRVDRTSEGGTRP